MMFIVASSIGMDLVQQRQRELQAAAEQHRRLQPSPPRRPRAKRTPARVEPASARQRRRTAHRHGWFPRRRGAALKQSS